MRPALPWYQNQRYHQTTSSQVSRCIGITGQQGLVTQPNPPGVHFSAPGYGPQTRSGNIFSPNIPGWGKTAKRDSSWTHVGTILSTRISFQSLPQAGLSQCKHLFTIIVSQYHNLCADMTEVSFPLFLTATTIKGHP